jgi:cell division protein FtsQ
LNIATGYLVRERLRFVVKFVVLVLAVILALELIFHLAVAPNLRLSRVEVSGGKPVDDAALLQLLGLREHEYYFSFTESELEDRLSGLPWIRSSLVSKVFPDQLIIHLTRRQPLVLSVENESVLAVDEDGSVFEAKAGPEGWDLPLVSGLTFPRREPGSRVPEVLVPLFRQLKDLQSSSPSLFRLVSEIGVRKNDRGSYDVVVYPAQTQVRILLGDQWNAQVLQQMFVLLDLMKKEGWTGKTKEIDFRAIPVVLRPRGS